MVNSGSGISSSTGYLGANYRITGAATVVGTGTTWANTNGMLNITNGGTVSTG
jgi:T5SS/PEP-CTERM-associated repeat protein